ncbi:MAG: hypothetical protein BWY76_03130 [bacterium ADurb.Bin429]|nr:MAG: hypothetical protein BWY76_03130 [bacterium ADurb.Bin429]
MAEQDVGLVVALWMAAEDGAHAFIAAAAQRGVRQRLRRLTECQQREGDIAPARRAHDVGGGFALLLPRPAHEAGVSGIVQPPRVTADHERGINHARSAAADGVIDPPAAHARLFRGEHIRQVLEGAFGPVHPFLVIGRHLRHPGAGHRRPEGRVAHGIARGVERRFQQRAALMDGIAVMRAQFIHGKTQPLLLHRVVLQHAGGHGAYREGAVLLVRRALPVSRRLRSVGHVHRRLPFRRVHQVGEEGQLHQQAMFLRGG